MARVVNAGTGSGLIQGPGHGLDRVMNLGGGRNLSKGQDGGGAGDLSRFQGSEGAVARAGGLCGDGA